MGSCQSSELAMQVAQSKKIDRQLAAEPIRLVQKLLLLGPGESGKSTCVKQMQILHASGFTEAEVEERKCIVYSNTVRSMIEILNGMGHMGVTFEDSSLTVFLNAIKRLWKDAGVQTSYQKRAQYQCHDSAYYFFDNIDRISEKDYRPTNHDILLTRVPTTGVVKLIFTLNNIDFNVYDVGGQRSERRKWIHFFDDVNAIIFVAAIGEYDQKIREDNQTNRLIEALELFDSISNSRFFVNSSMILFLNKKDIFEQKITKISLSITFPSYRGGLNYAEAVAYIRRQFQRLYKNQQKMYIHETMATDTNQTEKVFASVLDTIVQENLRDTGIL
ncbi:g-protein alpha subunit domain-containing protein [Ditylenchus destructor]|uniref:G-protein alpha subunit domain-containing protein n=1 Tax=Ditylenchus destructor TaxID=166010 RepID=A0AAD4QZM1_9BILA|nr:g-protein alpha subunit domain-containing protein [Ditylenchus destructor]